MFAASPQYLKKHGIPQTPADLFETQAHTVATDPGPLGPYVAIIAVPEEGLKGIILPTWKAWRKWAAEQPDLCSSSELKGLSCKLFRKEEGPDYYVVIDLSSIRDQARRSRVRLSLFQEAYFGKRGKDGDLYFDCGLVEAPDSTLLHP